MTANNIRILLSFLICLCFIFPLGYVFSNDEIKKKEELNRTMGTIIGAITDAETGEPLEMVSVVSQHQGDETNEFGLFRVPYQKPDTAVVKASRRDYIEYKTKIDIIAGQEVTLHFSMKKQQKPCCKLEGKWEITLTDNRITVNGFITFNNQFSDPLPSRPTAHDDTTLDEFGRFDIDLKPLLGENFVPIQSNSNQPVDSDTLFTEATGYVHNIDTATIILIPRMSDGGLSLEGQISNDFIDGKWYERGFSISRTGIFTMRKISRKGGP
jgi:hypothetical protein